MGAGARGGAALAAGRASGAGAGPFGFAGDGFAGAGDATTEAGGADAGGDGAAADAGGATTEAGGADAGGATTSSARIGAATEGGADGTADGVFAGAANRTPSCFRTKGRPVKNEAASAAPNASPRRPKLGPAGVPQRVAVTDVAAMGSPATRVWAERGAMAAVPEVGAASAPPRDASSASVPSSAPTPGSLTALATPSGRLPGRLTGDPRPRGRVGTVAGSWSSWGGAFAHERSAPAAPG